MSLTKISESKDRIEQIGEGVQAWTFTGFPINYRIGLCLGQITPQPSELSPVSFNSAQWHGTLHLLYYGG